MVKIERGANQLSVSDDVLVNKIYVIRDQKVMLDSDLAELYGVETKRLNERVRRNMARFPSDFMFQLTESEWNVLRSQIATSKDGRGGRTYLPSVFTEHGVLMLSSVLNSEGAIQVNIQIMRIFSKVRQMLIDNTELRLEIAEIKHVLQKQAIKIDGQDKNIELIFEYIDRLQERVEEPVSKRKTIGFVVGKNGKKNNGDG